MNPARQSRKPTGAFALSLPSLPLWWNIFWHSFGDREFNHRDTEGTERANNRSPKYWGFIVTFRFFSVVHLMETDVEKLYEQTKRKKNYEPQIR